MGTEDHLAGRSGAVRVLHLEDDPLDAELVKTALIGGGSMVDVTLVDSRDAFVSAISAGVFDVILADLNLPLFSGEEALAIARREVPFVPFIFVSGSMGEEAAVNGLLRGATDFVLKKNLSRLVPAVNRAVFEAKEKGLLRIAEEKKSEAVLQLQQSEQKYRRLVDGLRDIVFSLESDGTIRSLNPAFEKTTGWQVCDWIGKSFTSILHPDDRENAVQTLRDVAEGKVTGLSEYRIAIPTGGYIVVEISTTRELQQDQLAGFVGVARDMTSQIKLREQLLQAQRLESLGTLASGIAHDFNNILAIILNYADSIKEGPDGAGELTEQVDPILQAVNRGAALVKQILAFSRSGEMNLSFVPVNRLVKDLVTMLKETFPSSITFETDLTDKEPVLNVDRGQLYQSLFNLCLNSRDAIAQRTGEIVNTQGMIRIVTDVVDGDVIRGKFTGPPADGYVTISVSDNGMGMGKDTVRRAFEPFFTTKENQNGRGLGLAVVYGTVKGNSGFVDLESTEGIGTTITLYLPLEPSMGFGDSAMSAGTHAEVSGAGETILLVEDEGLLMNILDVSLKEKGYRTLKAEDGLSALRLFEGKMEDISLVVSDNGLPVMDGITLFGKLKEIDPDVKMILTSGYMEEGLKSELLEAGLKDFVEKPYKVEVVIDSINRILKNF